MVMTDIILGHATFHRALLGSGLLVVGSFDFRRGLEFSSFGLGASEPKLPKTP